MIHVCFSLHTMTRFLSTAMLSLFENTDSKVTVHLLHDNTLTQDSRDKLIQIAERYGQQLKFYNVEELCADRLAEIEEYFPQVRESQFSLASLYRLFIPYLLTKKIEKAIYLDCDIVVNLDIAELWQVELGDKPLGAISEFYQIKDRDASIGRIKKYIKICGEDIVKPEDYLNSGVMLMNLKVLRNEEATILAGMKFVGENPQFQYPDQDVLAYCFSTAYLKLPTKFNRLILFARPENEWTIDKKIYHFAAKRHCFSMDANDPYNQLFMDYFIKTPWVDSDTAAILSGKSSSRKSPAVSVVIPLYNEEEFIGECLDSLLAQTFQNFEVIVVDDCSTDSSYEIVESYLPKFDGRLKLTKTEKNMGIPGIPRNIGIKLAHGEYIQFLDSDDMILNHTLESLYKAAVFYDADVVYTSSFYRLDAPNDIYLYRDGTSRKMAGIRTDLTVDEPTTNLNRLLLEPSEGNFHACYTKFVRRDLLIKNKIFFPSLSNAEDFIWVINVYCHARRFLRISTPFYLYRRYNDNSITRTIRPAQEQCLYWCSSFVDFTKALYELEKENKVLAENPLYSLMTLKKVFAWCFNRTEYARDELDNEEFYNVLHEEFAKKFSYSSALLLPFFFSSINEREASIIKEKEANAYYIDTFNRLRRYLAAKIYVLINKKMDKETIQILSVSDKKAMLSKPEWWQRNGTCHIIDSYTGKVEIVAKAVVEGQVKIRLGGQYVQNPKDKTKRIPYWIDYTELTINEKVIFDTLTPAWHDKAYEYTMNAKAGEEVKIQVEWQPHRSDI